MYNIKYLKVWFMLLFFTVLLSCGGFFIQNQDEEKVEINCSVFPDLGTPGTEFTIIINAIEFKRDSVTNFDDHLFRWDFNNDNEFDTQWSDGTVVPFTSNMPGNHEIIVETKTPMNETFRDTIIIPIKPLIKLYENTSGYDLGSIDWSIDGTDRIAFDRPAVGIESAIWIVEYPNGETIQISESPAYFPEWSPDGNYILFRRNSTFWIVNVETKEEQLILDKNGIIPFIPNWSHNGREIIYTTINGIEKYRFSSQNISQLESDITYNLATWSMDDVLVVTASRNNQQSTIDVYDLEEEKLSSSHWLGFHYRGGKLDWSLDNEWLSIGFASTNTMIYIIDIGSGEIKYINISGLENTWYASWSADAKMLVFEGRLPGENKTIWGIEIPEDF